MCKVLAFCGVQWSRAFRDTLGWRDGVFCYKRREGVLKCGGVQDGVWIQMYCKHIRMKL